MPHFLGPISLSPVNMICELKLHHLLLDVIKHSVFTSQSKFNTLFWLKEISKGSTDYTNYMVFAAILSLPQIQNLLLSDERKTYVENSCIYFDLCLIWILFIFTWQRFFFHYLCRRYYLLLLRVTIYNGLARRIPSSCPWRYPSFSQAWNSVASLINNHFLLIFAKKAFDPYRINFSIFWLRWHQLYDRCTRNKDLIWDDLARVIDLERVLSLNFLHD